MEPALHELAAAQRELAASLDALEKGNADRAVEFRKAERLRNLRSWGTLALAAVLVWVALTNRSVLNTIHDVTGPKAQARQAAGVLDILQRNAIETDCRSRRQQARLPAPPDPGKPCIVQTDLAVYPGIAGQPPKGP